MASTDKLLKNRELLLLVADAAGGTLGGKTVAQKLIYFVGVALDQPTGHSAYYYGPYSDEFDAALNLATLADELSVTIERIPDWYGRADARRHIYRLTEQGEAEAAKIADGHAQEAQQVRATVEAIQEAVPEFRQKTLSAAAKIHMIVAEQDHALSQNELQALARELGWDLKQPEVSEAVDVLARLGLVELSS
jgi:DNA-binding MarR family transcriptional regulator